MSDLLAAAAATLGITGVTFIPVFVWLAFWLFQDWVHPEPRRRLFFAFLAGMLAVPLVLPFQKIASDLLPFDASLLASWAFIEEVVKLGLAWLLVLYHRSVDEPIDFPVYMITVALGFSAVENMLFLFSPFFAAEYLEGAITGNLRFLGATLIHVVSSALIGAFLAFSFFRSTLEKWVYVIVGVILATALHTFFNVLILSTGAERILNVFLGVWVGVIFLLLALERIKLLRPPSWWEQMFINSR